MNILKTTIKLATLILLGILFIFLSDEWLNEWLDPSSKFSFAFDEYTLFGISTLLFLLILIGLVIQQIKHSMALGKYIRYSFNIEIGISGMLLFLTLSSLVQLKSIGATDYIFLGTGSIVVLLSYIGKRKQ